MRKQPAGNLEETPAKVARDGVCGPLVESIEWGQWVHSHQAPEFGESP
jgi:hypothetical protein